MIGHVQVSAADLLAVRNALIAGDTNEAYHQLLSMADPAFKIALAGRDHWDQWEKIAEAGGHQQSLTETK